MIIKEGFPVIDSTFIGRNRELSIIEDFVFNSKKRFLYVHGERGIGKTSLIYKFIHEHKERLDNNVVILSAFNFDGLPNDLWHSSKDLLIIDDFFEFSRGNTVSLAGEINSLVDMMNFSTARKIILLSSYDLSNPSMQDRLSSFYSLKGGVDFLKIRPFSNKEFHESIEKIFYIDKEINFSEFYAYFENNSHSILTALNYFTNSNFHNGTEFLNFLNEPIRQSGLIDINGNPLDIDAEESKIITQTIEVVNNSLIEKVNNNPNLIYQMTPRSFEELIAELLVKEGFQVNLTKQTRDGGKDIFIAHKNRLGNFLYYIECKQYAPGNPVGVNLVRELYGTIFADRATAGLLVTSSYFTKDAISFTQNVQHQLSLKGYIDLKKWINETCKK